MNESTHHIVVSQYSHSSDMLAEERQEGQRLDKLFLACMVPDRHHFSLLAREVASGAQEERRKRRRPQRLLNAQ